MTLSVAGTREAVGRKELELKESRVNLVTRHLERTSACTTEGEKGLFTINWVLPFLMRQAIIHASVLLKRSIGADSLRGLMRRVVRFLDLGRSKVVVEVMLKVQIVFEIKRSLIIIAMLTIHVHILWIYCSLFRVVKRKLKTVLQTNDDSVNSVSNGLDLGYLGNKL